MSRDILPLKEAGGAQLSGGKASALAKLINDGFKVPDGFVITSAAYKNRGENLEREILVAFDKLGDGAVAVRSSAVAEDGQKAAWAGQMDTFLNVERAYLLEAVKKCWQSSSSARANAYAKYTGAEPGPVAVIIQKMVPSEVSGVAFSVHPVTNNTDQIAIEAVKGLGETLVSGQTTPDTYVLHKASGQIAEKHTASKPILSQKLLKAVGDTVQKIEGSFGYPVDVEWAITKGELFILQSRPITTLG